MVFSNEETYRLLKKIFQYVIPAIIYLFGTLNDIWNIPYGLQINASLIAVWVAFGIFLGISKAKFNNAIQGVIGDGGGEDDEISVG